MTDHYSVCETALQTILNNVIADPNVTISDYSPFDNGVSQFIVLQPDTFESTDQSWGMNYKNWNILIEIFQRFTYEAETMVNFRALRSSIINELDKYPTLNNANGVVGIVIAGDTGVLDVKERTNDNVILYRTQILRAVVRQQVDDISGGEYT